MKELLKDVLLGLSVNWLADWDFGYWKSWAGLLIFVAYVVEKIATYILKRRPKPKIKHHPWSINFINILTSWK